MFDIQNRQLITSTIIPNDIRDQKEVVLAEQPIPGLNYNPVSPGGNGNRKISFTLPLIKRNNTIGNVAMLKQFENLRNRATGLFGISAGQFTPNPKVLYAWGTGSVPMVWWVKKCDATHRQGWVNQLGMPQYSEIEFELWLDESNPLYKIEEAYRKVYSLMGEALGGVDVISSFFGGKPY
jgi:hypothetical protein